jgi:hypothetical protein
MLGIGVLEAARDGRQYALYIRLAIVEPMLEVVQHDARPQKGVLGESVKFLLQLLAECFGADGVINKVFDLVMDEASEVSNQALRTGLHIDVKLRQVSIPKFPGSADERLPTYNEFDSHAPHLSIPVSSSDHVEEFGQKP